jgi:Zn-dependent protease
MFSSGNFLDWSLPLFRVPAWVPGLRSINVRLHILYIIIGVSELLSATKENSIGVPYVATMMGVLFVLVLLHEFGHCLACRLVGGQAEQILMWPLGGLAMCRPPHRWQPALITTLGGPGVNFVLAPVFALALVAAGADWSSVIFNPFQPQAVVAKVYFLGGNWLAWLWAAHYMNLLLLAFNMLLPMYPMDGGRVVQEILWWRIGYKRSMVIAVNVGLAAAVVVGVFAMTTGESRLIGIALFGGFTCFAEKQRLAMMPDDPPWAYDTDKGYGGFRSGDKPAAPSKPSWFQRRAEKAAAKHDAATAADDAKMDAEVDRILAKIPGQGMGSLTAKERATLEQASKRGRSRG